MLGHILLLLERRLFVIRRAAVRYGGRRSFSVELVLDDCHLLLSVGTPRSSLLVIQSRLASY